MFRRPEEKNGIKLNLINLGQSLGSDPQRMATVNPSNRTKSAQVLISNFRFFCYRSFRSRSFKFITPHFLLYYPW